MDEFQGEPCGSVAAARELDRRAFEDLGLPGLVLMESAGAAAADSVLLWWSARHAHAAPAPRITVVCGAGNNGGDGWVVARRLLDRSASVLVLHAHAAEELSPDARRMRGAAERCGVRATTDRAAAAAAGCDLLVDAVLGTGARQPVGGKAAELLRWIRDHARQTPVVALDLPSGMDGDTGSVDPLTPRCVLTVTFGLMKTGLRSGLGRDFCGTLKVADLGLPAGFRSGSLARD